MVSRVSHTTFDCRDASAISTFWKQVLGFSDVPDDPNEPGDEECMIVGPEGEPRLLFVEVPEGKQVKNRVHIDLEPTDRSRDDDIQRVLVLGATPLQDLRKEDGTGWLVLADPEGNEFCILRSHAERAGVMRPSSARPSPDTGKSSALAELGRHGYRVVETDEPGWSERSSPPMRSWVGSGCGTRIGWPNSFRQMTIAGGRCA